MMGLCCNLPRPLSMQLHLNMLYPLPATFSWSCHISALSFFSCSNFSFYFRIHIATSHHQLSNISPLLQFLHILFSQTIPSSSLDPLLYAIHHFEFTNRSSFRQMSIDPLQLTALFLSNCSQPPCWRTMYGYNSTVCVQVIRGLNFRVFRGPGAIREYFNRQIFG